MRLVLPAMLAVCLLGPAVAKDLAFISPNAVDATGLLPPPPTDKSYQTTEELKLLHQIAADSTKDEIAAAEADAKNETVFLFTPVLGPDFTAARFPATAALFKQVEDDAEFFERPAKKYWQRARPYTLDTTLIPVCGPVKANFSYPSGHSTEAWTIGTVLAAMLPAKAPEIKARAAAYAFNREVCGVHYPSDVEEGHVLGLMVGQQLLASPEFQKAATAARAELAQIH